MYLTPEPEEHLTAGMKVEESREVELGPPDACWAVMMEEEVF